MLARDRIELLSPSLLTSHKGIVDELRGIAAELEIGYGWHYMLDFLWALDQLPLASSALILDAGAGWGVLQWYLAQQGAHVLSVDTEDRSDLPPRFWEWCRLSGLRERDLNAPARPSLVRYLPSKKPRLWPEYPSHVRRVRRARRRPGSDEVRYAGEVTLYTADVRSMPDVETASVDAVVSISSLEHNQREGIEGCISELRRVVKPGGALVVTLPAAKEADWFHEPSKGWCFSERSLREVFDLDDGVPSNFREYDELMERLRKSEDLQELMPSFYRETGESGLPWGVWDPSYLPVGVVKENR